MWWWNTPTPQGARRSVLTSAVRVPSFRATTYGAPVYAGEEWLESSYWSTAPNGIEPLIAKLAAQLGAKPGVDSEIKLHNTSQLTGPVAVSNMRSAVLAGQLAAASPDTSRRAVLAPTGTLAPASRRWFYSGERLILGGTTDESCRGFYVFDPHHGAVWYFNGRRWLELPEFPQRDAFMYSIQDKDALPGGFFSTPGAVLFHYYGDLFLVFGVALPESKLVWCRFDFSQGQWEDLSLNHRVLGASPFGPRPAGWEISRFRELAEYVSNLSTIQTSGPRVQLAGSNGFLTDAPSFNSALIEATFKLQVVTDQPASEVWVGLIRSDTSNGTGLVQGLRLYGTAAAPAFIDNVRSILSYSGSGQLETLQGSVDISIQGVGLSPEHRYWGLVTVGLEPEDFVVFQDFAWSATALDATQFFFTNVTNYRGNAAWFGLSTASNDFFSFQLDRNLDLLCARTAIPFAALEAVKGQSFSLFQHLGRTPRVEPFLDQLVSFMTHSGGREDEAYDSNISTNAIADRRSLFLDAVGSSVVRGELLDPSNRSDELVEDFADRSDTQNYVGTMSGVHKGELFQVDHWGRLKVLDQRHNQWRELFDFSYEIPEMDPGGQAVTTGPGGFTEFEHDFQLYRDPMDPALLTRFQGLGLLPVGWWDNHARLEIQSIPGLLDGLDIIAWWDVGFRSSIRKVGDRVTSWTSRVNGYAIEPDGVARQPRLEEGQYVEFDGIDDRLVMPQRLGFANANPDITVVMVGTVLGPGNFNGLDPADTPGQVRAWQMDAIPGGASVLAKAGQVTTAWGWRFNNTTSFEEYSDPVVGQEVLVTWQRDTGATVGDSRFYVLGIGEIPSSGGADLSSLPSSLDEYFIMGGGVTDANSESFAHIRIREILFLQENSDDARQRTEGYLSAKWGIRLDPSHPYFEDENAKLQAIVGRRGVYTGNAPNWAGQNGGPEQWAHDESGQPLFSSYWNPFTLEWERKSLPTNTEIRARFALAGSWNDEFQSANPVSGRIFEYDGFLYVLWVIGMTETSQQNIDDYPTDPVAGGTEDTSEPHLSGIPTKGAQTPHPPSILSKFSYTRDGNDRSVVLEDYVVLQPRGKANMGPAVFEVDAMAGRVWIIFQDQEDNRDSGGGEFLSNLMYVDLDTLGQQFLGPVFEQDRRFRRAGSFRDNRSPFFEGAIQSFTFREPQAYVERVEFTTTDSGSGLFDQAVAIVTYRLFSPDGRALNVRPRFDVNTIDVGDPRDPEGWRPATCDTSDPRCDGLENLASSPEGTVHTLVHNVNADFALPFDGHIQYELLPYDSLTATKGLCADIEVEVYAQGLVHGCNADATAIRVHAGVTQNIATQLLDGSDCAECSNLGAQTDGVHYVGTASLSAISAWAIEVCDNSAFAANLVCPTDTSLDGATMWCTPKGVASGAVLCTVTALPGERVAFSVCNLTSIPTPGAPTVAGCSLSAPV